MYSGCTQEVLAEFPGLSFMNCPKCGGACSCAMEPPTSELMPDLIMAEGPVGSGSLTTSASGGTEVGAWRDELADRLSRYRARRKAPPPRYPSLTLPFGKAEYTVRTVPEKPGTFSAFEGSSNRALALDNASPQVEVQPEPPAPPRIPGPAQQTGAKIIEFPRFAWAPPPPPSDQLAEAVGEQLRILEVPDLQPALPALGGITIEPDQPEAVEKRLGIDIPLQIAPLERRLAASAIDGLIVSFASALFGFIFWKVAAVRPPDVQALTLAAGTLAVFWAVYQYLLIVYSGSTPGLRAAGLELTRFDGSSTTRSLRRWRILAAYLSALSLGMGYG